MAIPLPRSLSPSKVSAFTSCPLAFRLSIIDRLPEPPSPAAVKGTLVHSALEGLFWNHGPGRRTIDAAFEELDGAWEALQTDAEYSALNLSDSDSAEFFADAKTLLVNYFALEDPNSVRAVGIELGLETDLGNMRLRGVIDRLDLNDDGELVVVDYKTGRSPSAQYEKAKLNGVHIYALLCERVLGRPPVEVRLLHLRDRVEIIATPNEQSLRGHGQRTTAVWAAIERACDQEEFRPRPSPLCRYCNFQELCPAFSQEVPVAAAS